MAQAPQGPTGAPRQNKTVKEFKGMNTQNRRNAIPEGSFAWLENIQPIGPGHLHSIPGRSTAVVRIPPLVPPVLCTDATERGQQPISIEERFDQSITFPGPQRTSWGFIDSAEEVFTLVGQATCAGGNMAYVDSCCQINHYQTPAILTHPALIDPDITLPFVNTTIGTSDEPIYGCRSADTQFKCYFPNSSMSVTYNLPAGYIATTAGAENLFCKKGTSIYFTCHFTVTPFDSAIVEYNAASGVLLNTFLTLPQFVHSMIAATDDFLYVLGADRADSTQAAVKKIDRSDGSLDSTFMLDLIGAFTLGVANDDLIYVVCAGNPASLYYISNFTDLVFVGYAPAQSITGLGNIAGTWVNGAIYYGGNGFGFSDSIFKITVSCPEGSPPTPLIASVTRGSASVAAGANIVVSWSDVLLPVANDHIWLLPAPTPPDLGIIPANLVVSRITDGLGTSSMNFLIPMGTTPGSYILAYMANDVIFVAKTATFTVT